MKSLIKLVLILVGIVLAAVVALAVFLPFYFDPNDYKDQISKAVQDQTGRELKIPGKISLTVFPWLGMNLGETSFGNAPGFGDQPFAEIKEANVHVKLMPLLNKQIELSTISLDGLKLHLARNTQGVGNWEGMSGSKTATPAPEASAKAPSGAKGSGAASGFSMKSAQIGGIDIKDSSVTWDDAQKGAHYQLEKFNFTTGSLSLGQSFKLNSSFVLSVPGIVNEVELKAEVKADVDSGSYSTKDLELNVTSTGASLPNGKQTASLTGNADFNMKAQTLKIADLQLKALGAKINGELNGSKMLDSPQFSGNLATDEFSVRDVFKNMGKPEPKTSDSGVLAKASLKAQFDGTSDSINLHDLSAKLDDTTLSGNAAVRGFSKPAINCTLNLDGIDLDRYFPPAEKKEKSGGGGDEGDKAPAAATKVPVDFIKSLELDGKLHVGKLKAKGLHFDNADLAVTSHNGVLQLQPLTANFYQGHIQMTGKVDASSARPGYGLNASVQGVQIEPMLKDMLGKAQASGTGNITLNVTASGDDADAIKRALGGSAAIKLENGQIKGVNLGEKLRAAQALSKGQKLTDSGPQTTDFTAITATLPIANGVISNNDLSAQSPAFRVGGSGSASLPANSIDYLLKVSVVNTVEGQGGADLGNLKNLTIPVRIHGDLTAPEWNVDLGSMLKDKAKEALDKQKEKAQSKLKDALTGALGGKAASQGTTSQNAAPSGATTGSAPATTDNAAPAPAKKKKKSDKDKAADFLKSFGN